MMTMQAEMVMTAVALIVRLPAGKSWIGPA